MNKERKAIETNTPEDWEPIAYARSNRLMAVLWKTEDGCHFTILGVCPETGAHDTLFQPRDAEDVIRLTVVMSFAMHLDGNVVGELGDDLGCMAHCLSQPLGIDLNSLVPRPETMQ